MADLNYTVDINTRGAESALSGLQSTILGFGAAVAGAFTFNELVTAAAKFQDLRTSLQVLYGDAETGSAAFDQIKQFATESVFAVEDLTTSVIKLKAAGLDPTVEQLRLFSDVAAVSADQVGTLQAITDLYARTTAGGLGLEELNRLGDRGIPVFKILSDTLGVTRLELSKLGQSAEGAQLILAALEEGLQEQFGGASAARANNLSQAIDNLGDSLANAFDTIGQSGFNDALARALRGISAFIESNEALIVSIGQGLGAAIDFVVENLNIFIGILAGFAFAAAAKGFIAIALAIKAIGLAILRSPLGLFAAALGTVVAVATDFDIGLGEAKDAVDELSESVGPLTGELKDNADILENGAEKARELINNNKKAASSTRDAVAEYSRLNSEFRDRFDLQTQLVNATDAQRVETETLAKVERDYLSSIRPLQQELQNLKKQDTEQNKAQIATIEAQIAAITEQYNTSLPGIKAMIAERQRELELLDQKVEKELAAAEAAKLLERATEKTARIQRDLTESTQDAVNNLQDLNLTPLQRDLVEIERSITQNVNRSVQELKRLLTETNDPAVQAKIRQQISAIEGAAARAIQTQQELARQARTQQRSFSQGWADAFNSYRDEATNSAKVAAEVFTKTTQGLEDTIVNFVKTGKFEFRDLVNDIAETLLRSQIKRLIADVFAPDGLLGGLGSLFGGLDSLLGGGGKPGETPNNPIYVKEITGGGTMAGGIPQLELPSAGAQTPGFGDIFSGLSDTVGSVVNSVKNIFSSGSGGGIGGAISSTIGSISKGIGSLFGGFFATGGQIPAGRFGVVGERGPELINGPATITPMQPMDVTINISAVDAPSFQALVARDPGFIAAVAQQGARAVPQRR